ncbi:hypothetical protein LTS18_011177, partial [Coniosporium uncinatum]
MARPEWDNGSSSDETYQTDADATYETDSTLANVDDDGDEEVTDEEDQVHPPEYYLTRAEEVNKSDLIEEDYAPGSTLQLDRIEEQWYQKIDPRMNRQMHRVLRRVAKQKGLSNEKREKPPMYTEDVVEILQTNLTTTEKRYSHGRHRIQLALWFHGAFITANRPQALLNLRYRHIAVTLLRDPKGGPHRILLEFTFEFTKTYLGMKDANTFPIPEIIFDPSLILSPHVFLLGLIFADGAFLAPNPTSPDQLSKLDIPPGCNALPLPLDPRMDDVYVFRRSVRTRTGWKVSPDLSLPRWTVSPWIKRLGEITGFLQVARPYCLRYGAGKAFDDNGQSGVSDALRNLMMQHADTRTFLKYYLPQCVTADTQA